MYRTTFYYKLEDKYSIEYVYAIKHCKRPARTKVYKELETKSDCEYSTLGYLPSKMQTVSVPAHLQELVQSSAMLRKVHTHGVM